eukprot:TRINITY_DN6468_c0_g4_i1.p1 TRINITY_DN6468_c0_g4~~TRINITY_DN6468_c0_g4_i1.p1  ORF type:complete len:186 (+),score=43.63 TRINITY_DN6468_c0_g4_i1:151-708(+)
MFDALSAMNVFVKCEDGTTRCLEVDPKGKVRDLRQAVANELRLSGESVVLRHEGEVMEIEQELQATSLVGGDEVAAVVDEACGSSDVLRAWEIPISSKSLIEAAKMGDMHVVRLLLATNEVTVSSTHNGFTPLHAASRAGYIDIVNFLLTKRSMPLHKDGFGWTSIDLAAVNGHFKCVAALKAHA